MYEKSRVVPHWQSRVVSGIPEMSNLGPSSPSLGSPSPELVSPGSPSPGSPSPGLVSPSPVPSAVLLSPLLAVMTPVSSDPASLRPPPPPQPSTPSDPALRHTLRLETTRRRSMTGRVSDRAGPVTAFHARMGRATVMDRLFLAAVRRADRPWLRSSGRAHQSQSRCGRTESADVRRYLGDVGGYHRRRALLRGAVVR